jgi:hypothetical protein
MANLATKCAKVNRRGAEFASIDSSIDRPPALAGLAPRKDEIFEESEQILPNESANSSFESSSNALTTILYGLQLTMGRPFTHQEPIHRGLPPPRSST